MELIRENYFVNEQGYSYQMPIWNLNNNTLTPVFNGEQLQISEIRFARDAFRDKEIKLLKNSGEFTTDDKVLWLDAKGDRYYEGHPAFYMVPTKEIKDEETGKVSIVPFTPKGEILNLDIQVKEENLFRKGEKVFLPFILEDVTVEARPGVTFQSILGILIEELQFRNSQNASRENSLALTKLEEASLWIAKGTNV